jgi:CRISPR system Cascade subunit CasC
VSRFLQLHLLTFYPPSNLNRDDTGRPKTAEVGGATRLRISSQSLKRAWRTSPVFQQALAGHMGQRTQRMGKEIRDHLVGRGVPEDEARAVARSLLPVFGKPSDEKSPGDEPLYTRQLAFVAPEERAAALVLAERIAAGEKMEKIDPGAVLRRTDTAADIAMFGRMLADAADYNRDAAVQVAHAITTHRVAVEDDFYSAVDDLKLPAEDAGAGFIGEAGFGSGVFYLYACVDRESLVANLGGDEALAKTAVAALVRAAATVSPSGKQNSFAALARAHYVLAERGDAQPRTLAAAFAHPVRGADLIAASVAKLEETRAAFEAAYGPAADATAVLDVAAGRGTLDDVVAFAAG